MGRQRVSSCLRGLLGLAIFLGFERVHGYVHSMAAAPKAQRSSPPPRRLPIDGFMQSSRQGEPASGAGLAYTGRRGIHFGERCPVQGLSRLIRLTFGGRIERPSLVLNLTPDPMSVGESRAHGITAGAEVALPDLSDRGSYFVVDVPAQ